MDGQRRTELRHPQAHRHEPAQTRYENEGGTPKPPPKGVLTTITALKSLAGKGCDGLLLHAIALPFQTKETVVNSLGIISQAKY